jgi:hypothetical protein
MDKLKMLVVRNTNIFAHGIKKVGKWPVIPPSGLRLHNAEVKSPEGPESQVTEEPYTSFLWQQKFSETHDSTFIDEKYILKTRIFSSVRHPLQTPPAPWQKYQFARQTCSGYAGPVTVCMLTNGIPPNIGLAVPFDSFK